MKKVFCYLFVLFVVFIELQYLGVSSEFLKGFWVGSASVLVALMIGSPIKEESEKKFKIVRDGVTGEDHCFER